MALAAAVSFAIFTVVTNFIFMLFLLLLVKAMELKGSIWEIVRQHISDFFLRNIWAKKNLSEQGLASTGLLHQHCSKLLRLHWDLGEKFPSDA